MFQPVQMGFGLVCHLSASFGDVWTVVKDSWPVRVSETVVVALTASRPVWMTGVCFGVFQVSQCRWSSGWFVTFQPVSVM